MVKERTSFVVLLPLLVIGVGIAGIGQVANALTEQLACELRWNRDDPKVEQTVCIDSLATELKQNRTLGGYIVSYAGRQARPNEAREAAYDIRRFLIEKRGVRGRQLVAVDGGFREEASVELFLLPSGSATPKPNPTLEPDLVEFIDEPQITHRALRRSRIELLNSVLFKATPVYPPLAKAAGVEGDVGVKVLLDNQGAVIRSRAVYGHPLLRESAEKAALQWRFAPSGSESESITVHGLVIFQFVLASTKPDLIQKR